MIATFQSSCSAALRGNHGSIVRSPCAADGRDQPRDRDRRDIVNSSSVALTLPGGKRFCDFPRRAILLVAVGRALLKANDYG
jgi:hypothetical protein